MPNTTTTEITITANQRTLLERIALEGTDGLELAGREITTGRHLDELELVASSLNGRRAWATAAGLAWLEAHPRRGRPRLGDAGLVERVDVRVSRATAERLDAEAKAKGVKRNTLARLLLEAAVGR